MAERESRQWWAVTQYNTVQEITGYKTEDVLYWWVPELGMSMAETIHLFPSRAMALDKAVSLTRSAIAGLETHLQRLLQEARDGR